MPNVYGHRKCKSEEEVITKGDFAGHGHGIIGRQGKVAGVKKPMLLMTDADGNIVAAREINADLTISGTVKADKIIGAVYM